MAEPTTLPWRRGQDWVSLAAGGYLAFAPLWVEVSPAGRWAMGLIGLAVVALSLVALAVPSATVDEGLLVATAVMALAAPWVFSFTEATSAAWTSWLVGILVGVSALGAIPAAHPAHRPHAP